MDQNATFVQKMRTLDCTVVNHARHIDYTELSTICINPQCKLPQRACCYICNDLHKDHKQLQIPIQEVQRMLRGINENGSEEMQKFQALKAQILQMLKEMENAIDQKMNQNPFTRLNQIYKAENFNHETVNQIGLILGNNAILKDSRLESKPSANQMDLDGAFESVKKEMQAALNKLKGLEQKLSFSPELKHDEIGVKGD